MNNNFAGPLHRTGNVKRHFWKLMVAVIAVAAIGCALAPAAKAGTHVWTGTGGNSLWSTPGNWQGNSKPLFGEVDVKIVFPTNGTASSIVDIPNLVVSEILVQRGASNSITLGGSAAMKLTLATSPGLKGIYAYSGHLILQESLELVLSNQVNVFVHGELDCPITPNPFDPCVTHIYSRVAILSKVSGPGGLNFTGRGESVLGGSVGNTFGGLTRVEYPHKLRLAKSSGNAVGGDLLVDAFEKLEPSGWSGFTLAIYRGEVISDDDHQIANSGTITNRGFMNLSNRVESVGHLYMGPGARLDTGSGQVNLGGLLWALGTTNGMKDAFINGRLGLGTLSAQERGRSFHAETNTQLNISASIVGSGVPIVKSGPGAIAFWHTNNFDSRVTVSGGTLYAGGHPTVLGTTNEPTFVQQGARLVFGQDSPDGGGCFFCWDFGSNSKATNSEPIVMTGGSLSGEMETHLFGPLYLTNTAKVTGLNLRGPVSGNGGLTIMGHIVFGGSQPNTFVGPTVLTNNAFVELNKAAGITAISGDLDIGYFANVYLRSSEQVGDSSTVVVGRHAKFVMDGYSDTIGHLTLVEGMVTSTGGVLSLRGNLTATPGDSYWSPAVIEVPIHLKSGGSHAIHVNAWTNQGAELVIKAVLSSDPAIGFTKTGNGAVTMATNNTFGGAVVVEEGGVISETSTGFGVAGGIGVYVKTNGYVLLKGSLQIGNEPLTFMGGRVLCAGGSSIWRGPVTCVTDALFDLVDPGAALQVSGAIGGAGGLVKYGPGRLELTGTAGNTFNGVTAVNEGELWLAKTNAIAVPSHLMIGTTTNAAAARCFGNGQLPTTSFVVAEFQNSLFDLQGYSQGLASFAGAANVNIGAGVLTIGATGDGSGYMGGTITGSGVLHKYGTGTLTLTGNNSFSGITYAHTGTLAVNGSHALSRVNVSGGAKLTGDGSVGAVGAYGFGANNAWIMPGNGAGKLTTKNFTNGALAKLQVQLNGPAAGTGYDQVEVAGTVCLGGELQVLRGFSATNGAKFMIIRNDGVDAVVGTFNGLAQNATFWAGGAQFQVSYQGGDGNDVMLTQLTNAPTLQLGGVQKLANGHMQVSASGMPGENYMVQANTNLNTINWIVIGTAVAAGNGAVSFIDTNAPNFPIRFYRFVTP